MSGWWWRKSKTSRCPCKMHFPPQPCIYELNVLPYPLFHERYKMTAPFKQEMGDWVANFFLFINVCHPPQVAVGRVHQPLLSTSATEGSHFGCTLPPQPINFISKHTSDGKFVFIDQRWVWKLKAGCEYLNLNVWMTDSFQNTTGTGCVMQ